jgi:hypothetical protein
VRRGFVPTATLAKLLGVLVVPVAVIATGVGVVAASYSSFSSATSSPASSWSSGNVALTNDSGVGTAAFAVTALKPGSSGEHCITVTSTGSLPAGVKLYATAPTTTNALSGALILTITQGTGGGPLGSCTGFNPGATSWTGSLTAFDALTGYTNGVLPWTTSGSATQTQAYKITYSLPISADSTAQNLQAGVTFTWEAQNS